jgi:ABC-type Na+ efflux pump permease subunit
LAVAAIVAICIGGPIMEMFDQWDHTFQDGNDTEANVVIAALCIGVAVAIGTIAVVARIRALASNVRRYALASRVVVLAALPFAHPSPTSSPPRPLRV